MTRENPRRGGGQSDGHNFQDIEPNEPGWFFGSPGEEPQRLDNDEVGFWNPVSGNGPKRRAALKQFPTGAVRSSDADAARYDLISPIGLRRLAETCGDGAEAYGDHNWERGMPVVDLLNHAIRHVYLYLAGDRSEDHLAHSAWNLFGAMHSEELWPALNDQLRGPGCTAPDYFDADG